MKWARKKELILVKMNGATVLYGSASELRATLDYDFAEEKKNISADRYMTKFGSGIYY